MEPVRFGVISTAKIGIEKVIPAMQRARHCRIVAIASRERPRAEAAAAALGIAKAYGSYDELLADPEIEAVYNPLPNHLHVPISIEAAAAGKHVLCEKPIALTAEEAERLIDGARPRRRADPGSLHGAPPPAVAARAGAGARAAGSASCGSSRAASAT